jgi:hypothetical protein
MKRRWCVVAGVLFFTFTLVPFGSRRSVSAGQDPAPDASAKTVLALGRAGDCGAQSICSDDPHVSASPLHELPRKC